MWDQLQTGPVDLPCSVRLLGVQLLKQGVLDPEVDVPLPVPLLRRGREVGDGPLVHLTKITMAAYDAGQKTEDCPYSVGF